MISEAGSGQQRRASSSDKSERIESIEMTRNFRVAPKKMSVNWSHRRLLNTCKDSIRPDPFHCSSPSGPSHPRPRSMNYSRFEQFQRNFGRSFAGLGLWLDVNFLSIFLVEKLAWKQRFDENKVKSIIQDGHTWTDGAFC